MAVAEQAVAEQAMVAQAVASRPRRLTATRAFEALTVIPLVAWMTFEFTRDPRSALDPMLLVWLVAIVVVDLLPLSISSNLQFSLSFPLQLAVAVLYAPHVATAVAFVGTFDPREFRRELPVMKALFIRAQIAISVLAESELFHRVATLDSAWYVLVGVALLVTVVGYSLNVLLVAWYLHLETGTPAPQIAREMHRGILGELILAYMGLALFGVVIAVFFVNEGVLSVLVFLAPLAFARQMMTRTHSLKQATDELQEQRKQLEDIVGHTSDGIFLVDPQTRIVTWNPAMERITGRPAEEAVGRLAGRVFADPSAEAEHAEPASPMFQGGTGDIVIITQEGAERWIRYNSTPIRDSGDRIKGSVVVARDVTAELAAERMQTEFIANVSHELRSPLTPIKGYLASLYHGQIGKTEEERREFYGTMLRQADRLERLIGEVLDATKVESGRLSLEARCIELTRQLANETESLAGQYPSHRIRFREGGQVTVMADPFRLLQIVGNLVSNAVKYSPSGSEILVSVVQNSGSAVVSVRDEGYGIPLSDQDLVFERFHRVDNGLTRRTGGTGLGLYISKRLVEAMSGRIWLRSAPGSGSTFSFSLPLASVDSDASEGVGAGADPQTEPLAVLS